ncbi:hypothetical protein [Albibacterium indicum]|uniref:hypothetical protein n=1 Tax=Albibacterium indicum TaxID=2292082 RepID=UPI000E4C358E|nr:hypothetical protein [Pedobacter indicus]
MKSRKLPTEQKRIHEIKIRLNSKEKQKLDRIISLTNQHAPDIFRKLLSNGKVPGAAVPLLDVQTYYQLRKLASNYNQYVKAVHQKKITEVDRNLGHELNMVLETIRRKIS